MRAFILFLCGWVAVGAQLGAQTPERAVLAVMLANCCSSPDDSAVLAGRTAAFRNPGPPPPTPGIIPSRMAVEWRRLPQSLMARLDSLSRVERPTATLDLPPTAIILSDSVLGAVFASGVEGGWAEFGRRYPGRHGFIRLSPIAFNTDATEAMVYREVHCGGRCGDGTLFWLRRGDDGRWSVVGSLRRWVS